MKSIILVTMLLGFSPLAAAVDLCSLAGTYETFPSTYKFEMICTNPLDSQSFPLLVFSAGETSNAMSRAIAVENIRVAKIYFDKGYTRSGEYFIK